MITDLETIKKLGKVNENINYRFRSYLKGKDSDRLDSTVHDLFKFYVARIDCTECGNCCAILKPRVQNEDILRICHFLKKSETDFKDGYVETDQDNEMCFKDLPCPFLSDKKCAVYELRPEDCREFPYLYKDEFQSRLLGVIDYYSICPIVFNVYEDLKRIFHFR